MTDVPSPPYPASRPFFSPDADLRAQYAPIQADLDRVDVALERLADGSPPLIREAAGYVVRGSGKRLRPALLILCARASGYRGEDHVALSAVVEVIHAASLIHDDIIDGADLRRGQATPHHRWGLRLSVLLGDFLYLKAFRLALDFKDDRIVRSLARAASHMIEGVLMECAYSRDPTTSEDIYLEIVAKKTAALFAAGCSIGGILGGLAPGSIDALSRFGAGVGTAFQIVDDLLDFTGSPGELGKPVLSDLREGRITLPLIAALRRAEPAGRERIASLLRTEALSPAAMDEILAFVTGNGALAEARRRAVRETKDALACLDALPASAHAESLRGLATLIANRTH
ncbi:MAG: polyprenyl synthetase family protein [Candidatus Aminicenantes bacterium]|nr:polyprenyl synthetase family protein [Candidatus Aminicenantes bacterium]